VLVRAVVLEVVLDVFGAGPLGVSRLVRWEIKYLASRTMQTTSEESSTLYSSSQIRLDCPASSRRSLFSVVKARSEVLTCLSRLLSFIKFISFSRL
jgi:hypothetical protein